MEMQHDTRFYRSCFTHNILIYC